MKLIKKKNVTFLLSGGGSNLHRILKKNLTSKKFNTISIISNNQVSKQIKELIKSNELEIKIYEKVSNLKPKLMGDCDLVFSVGYLKKINSEIIENYDFQILCRNSNKNTKKFDDVLRIFQMRSGAKVYTYYGLKNAKQ